MIRAALVALCALMLVSACTPAAGTARACRETAATLVAGLGRNTRLNRQYRDAERQDAAHMISRIDSGPSGLRCRSQPVGKPCSSLRGEHSHLRADLPRRSMVSRSGAIPGAVADRDLSAERVREGLSEGLELIESPANGSSAVGRTRYWSSPGRESIAISTIAHRGPRAEPED